MRKNLGKSVFGLLLALAFAVPQSAAFAAEDAQPLDVLRVGVPSMPGQMDPGSDVNNALMLVEPNVFDTLMLKEDGELTSNLCESWKNIDETTWEFELKQGITFQNGEELTAEDVEYSFERALFGDPAYFASALTSVFPGFKDVEVLDTYSFRITTESADPVLLERLSSTMGIYIVPKAYIEEVGDSAFGMAPIGTGPYKVVEITPSKITLEYYEGYYGERPIAGSVEYYHYPEVSTRLTALLNDEIDMAFGLYPENVATLEERGYQANSALVNTIHMLSFNETVAPMDDPLFRKALNLAIDRDSLVEYIWQGQAKVLNSYNFPAYGDYYIEDFPEYEYDPEKAAELVAESKYNGETIYYELKSGYYTLGNEVAEAICSMWQAIGVNAEVRYADKADYSSFHVHNWSNGIRFADPAGGLYLLWGPGSAADTYYWQTEDTWEKFTEYGETLLTSFDFDERYEANRKMMELWEEECPGTSLFQVTEICGIREGLNFERSDFPVDFRAEHLSIAE